MEGIENNTEVWLPVVGYEGYYEVSSLSRVRSVERVVNEGKKGAYLAKGVVLRPGLGGTGYYTVSLCGKSYKLHRLVAIAFIENPLNKDFVNHKNGIKTDNRIENLEWCTSVENNRHAFASGLKPNTMGENHWLSKLNPQKVKQIRKYYSGNIYTQIELCKMYSLSPCTINNVVHFKSWKHVKHEDD